MKNKILFTLFYFSFLSAVPPANSHHRLALHFLEQHNKESGLHHLLKAYEQNPEHEDLILHLASIYFFGREYEKSIPYFEQFLAKKPDDADIIFYLASAHNRQGKFKEGSHYFKKSFELNNDELAKGEFLKNCLRSKKWTLSEKLLNPTIWWYNENIYGKKILLELGKDGNGIGDMIFFLRYAKHLKQAGAQVTISVPDVIHTLMCTCPYVDNVLYSTETNPAPFDHVYSICIGSYMLRAKNRLFAPSRDIPYLVPDASLVTQWKEKLAQDNNIKIGIYWEGTPNKATFLGKQLENPRTLPFNALQPLQKLSGISWYSLQKDPTQLPSGFPIKTLGVDFDESNGAFMDTAAVMQHLDLVISIDGSVAHLAGALGVPVWVILPCENDYRWFENQDTTPWYPTMRLFQQKQFGNWQDVVEEVKKELAQMTLLES